MFIYDDDLHSFQVIIYYYALVSNENSPIIRVGDNFGIARITKLLY